MSFSLNSPSIITKRNVDEYDNPISVELIETKQVMDVHCCIPTDQVIDRWYPVTIEGYIQVYNREDVNGGSVMNSPTRKHTTRNYELGKFYVDYDQGVLYFDDSQVGKTITYSYAGIGCTLISANRVFTKLDKNGQIIETLEEAINLNTDLSNYVETGLNELNTALAKLEETTNTLVNESRTDVESIVNTTKTSVENFISESRNVMNDIMDESEEAIAENQKTIEDLLRGSETKLDETISCANKKVDDFISAYNGFDLLLQNNENTRENNESIRKRNERLRQENELKRIGNDRILNDLITAAQDSEVCETIIAEVIGARGSIDGTVYNNLNERLDKVECRSVEIFIGCEEWVEDVSTYPGMTVYTYNIPQSLNIYKISNIELLSNDTNTKQLTTFKIIDDAAILISSDKLDGNAIITLK